MNSDEEFHDTAQDLDESTDENGIDRERISDNLVDFMGTLVPGRHDTRILCCVNKSWGDARKMDSDEWELNKTVCPPGMEPPRDSPPPALPPKTRPREPPTNLDHAVNGSASEEEPLPSSSREAPPLPVVPPRVRAQLRKDKRPVSNGLPPTPKVHVSGKPVSLKVVSSKIELGTKQDTKMDIGCRRHGSRNILWNTLQERVLYLPDGCVFLESVQRVSATYQLHGQLGESRNKRWSYFVSDFLSRCFSVMLWNVCNCPRCHHAMTEPDWHPRTALTQRLVLPNHYICHL